MRRKFRGRHFRPIDPGNEARTIRLFRGDSPSALQHRRSANLRDGVNPFRAQDSFEPCRLRFRRRRKVGRSRLLWDGDGSRNGARARCGVRKPRGIPSFAPNFTRIAIFLRVSAAVWRTARPGRGTPAPVERIARRGLLSQSLGFHHAGFREVSASVRPSRAVTRAIQGVPTVR